MMKLLMAATAALSLFGGFRDLYCPACERFSADAWTIDAKGLCLGCGYRPVGVEATSRRWFWCASQEEWRDDTCARRCCTEWTATALAEPPAEARMGPASFCPPCRTFRGFTTDRDGRDVCGGCGKAAATVEAAEITWYGCLTDKAWALHPCPSRCCTPRVVRVPIHGAPPTPRPIALDEEPGVLVSSDWLDAHLDDLNLVLVHVEFGREAPDAAGRPTFSEGHIPFAHPLEWSAVAVERDGLVNEFPPAPEMAEALRRISIDFHSRIVLYDTGAGLEAARAFVALEYLGLAGRVSVLDGHWKRWVREGREISRVYSGVEPSDFAPVIRPEVIVPLRVVADVVWTALEPVPTAVLVDGRPALEYSGREAGKGIRRAGHLPGAMSLPWTSTILSLDDPRFRPEVELRGLFESKGARPGRRLLVYCRTGVQASHTYVVARHLGLSVALYDGSYAEWNSHPELPVETPYTLR